MALGILASGASCVAIALLLLQAASPHAAIEERLARHRNLGKAFFENPTTQTEAVAEFKRALDLAPESARERLNFGLALLAAGKTEEGIAELEKVQKQDPRLPHTWFNLGIQYKKLGDFPRAEQQFAGMLKLVPDEPISHYNLGALHRIAGRTTEAVQEFETASRLDPNLAAPHFQLFNLYRQLGRTQDAQRRLTRFQEIKKQQDGAAVPEDVEWSFYSEIYEPIDAKAAAADTNAPASLRFISKEMAPGVSMAAPIDFDADSRPDLLAIVSGTPRIFRSGSAPVTDTALDSIKGAIHGAPADSNNDGFPDLAVVTGQGPILLINNKGRFTLAPLQVPAGRYLQALWLDYDHDYDLDLIFVGESTVLLRNEGAAGFANHTADIAFADARALSALAFRLIPDSKGMDFVITYPGRAAVLYRDRLAGKYEPTELPAIPAGARLVEAADADHNGAIDVVFEFEGKIQIALNTDGIFRTVATPAPFGSRLADVENRGVLDLVGGGNVYRNTGQGSFAEARAIAGMRSGTVRAVADWNSDGKLDVATVAPDGALAVASNQTVLNNRWMRVALTGVKNLKLAYGAEVEVKAGLLYQKRVYSGVPLHFGLRGNTEAEAVRITWPNGLIQSEARQAGLRAQSYKEAERLSGSCPQVFTWNGREFVYVTDVLGVAPLGAAAGDGEYFPTDHLDHIQIPSGALVPEMGKYQIRLTEELAEVAYIDQVRLVAVDHPSGTSIFTNEKFQAPPYPALRLFTVRERIVPHTRRDSPGAVEFDFPAAILPNPLLVLTGWVDWADGSTFLAKAQEGRPLVPPALEVRGADGRWKTLIQDIGLPAGKPKSIVVELPPGAWTQMRISTNIAVHWTSAFLATGQTVEKEVAETTAAAAVLRFRGFSRARIHPKRLEPEMFYYPDPLPVSMWNPTPGSYTRYGEVTELASKVDDRMVIMGSGDELALSFHESDFPPVPPGNIRSFVLAVDGWAKDRDPNTAWSQTVEPLPFHGMSEYPYSAAERFPDTDAHRAWQREYNTRPALRPLRPLFSRSPALPALTRLDRGHPVE